MQHFTYDVLLLQLLCVSKFFIYKSYPVFKQEQCILGIVWEKCIGQLNRQKRTMRGTEDLANIQSDTFLTHGKCTLLWSNTHQQYVVNKVHITIHTSFVSSRIKKFFV